MTTKTPKTPKDFSALAASVETLVQAYETQRDLLVGRVLPVLRDLAELQAQEGLIRERIAAVIAEEQKFTQLRDKTIIEAGAFKQGYDERVAELEKQLAGLREKVVAAGGRPVV